MKNADLPAMPQNNSETLCRQTGTANPLHSGLTKREQFAMAAMQGILSGTKSMLSADIVEASVAFADQLLAELERSA